MDEDAARITRPYKKVNPEIVKRSNKKHQGVYKLL
jgi:hypothetical protein